MTTEWLEVIDSTNHFKLNCEWKATGKHELSSETTFNDGSKGLLKWNTKENVVYIKLMESEVL